MKMRTLPCWAAMPFPSRAGAHCCHRCPGWLLSQQRLRTRSIPAQRRAGAHPSRAALRSRGAQGRSLAAPPLPRRRCAPGRGGHERLLLRRRAPSPPGSSHCRIKPGAGGSALRSARRGGGAASRARHRLLLAALFPFLPPPPSGLAAWGAAAVRRGKMAWNGARPPRLLLPLLLALALLATAERRSGPGPAGEVRGGGRCGARRGCAAGTRCRRYCASRLGCVRREGTLPVRGARVGAAASSRCFCVSSIYPPPCVFPCRSRPRGRGAAPGDPQVVARRS